MCSRFTALLLALLFTHCGDAASLSDNVPTGVTPTVLAVDPAQGAAGATITVYGFGFSMAPTENVVLVGGQSIPAQSYATVNIPAFPGASEAITFVIPAGVTLGSQPVTVVINDQVSNTNVSLTIQ